MIRNLDAIREKDPKLYEALHDLAAQQSAITEQVNGNPAGQPLAPPSISGVKVSAQNGHFQVAIQDQGPIYRDVHYYVEHADNPHFTDAHVVHLGHSRNLNLTLGNVTRYFRAYSAYASSAAGSPAYHGGAANPQPVNGGGSVGGPDFLASEGSGTGTPDQGVSGPGPVPFRSRNGVPPIRGESLGVSGSVGNPIISPAAAGAPSEPSAVTVSGTGGGGSSPAFVTVTQSGLAALAATLGTASAGLQAYVSDFDHTLVWTGTGWRFASGERSGFIQSFLIDPNPTTGWQLCDGTQVSFLQFDGTLLTTNAGGVVPIPDLVSAGNKAAHVKLGSPATGVVVAPVAPTMSGSVASGTTGVTVPANTGSNTTGVSIPANTGAAAGTTSFPQGTIGLVTVASSTHVHAEGPVTDPGHTHTEGPITDPGHTHAVGTIAAATNGEPQLLVLRPWFRR